MSTGGDGGFDRERADAEVTRSRFRQRRFRIRGVGADISG